MTKSHDDHQMLVNAYGENFAKIVEEVHNCNNWKFDTGMTGIFIETTEDNRWEVIKLLEKLKKID